MTKLSDMMIQKKKSLENKISQAIVEQPSQNDEREWVDDSIALPKSTPTVVIASDIRINPSVDSASKFSWKVPTTQEVKPQKTIGNAFDFPSILGEKPQVVKGGWNVDVSKNKFASLHNDQPDSPLKNSQYDKPADSKPKVYTVVHRR